MKIFVKIMWLLLFINAGPGYAQAINSPSKDVTFKLVDENPLIIQGDMTFYPGEDREFVVAVPWYMLSFTITNNSNEILYLQNIELKTTNELNGVLVESLSSLDLSFNCNAGETRAFVGIIYPGETFKGMSKCTNNEWDKISSFDPSETWIVHSLPNADSEFYKVKLTPLGYFVPPNSKQASGKYHYEVNYVTR